MLKSKMFIVLALLPLALFSMAAEAKLYKWVDKNGETHYGEVIPPEYAGDKKVQIEHGMEVQQAPAAAPGQPKAAAKKTPAEVEQERRDRALLNSYTNEGEIDLARDRNLQGVNARINGIQLQLKSAQDDLNGYLKEKTDSEKAGKPADRVLLEQIAQANDRIARLNSDMAAAQADAEKIKARFAADKDRYHELTSSQPK